MATLNPWPLPGTFGWEAFFDVSLGRTRLAGKPSLMLRWEAAGCEAFRAARLLRSHYKHAPQVRDLNGGDAQSDEINDNESRSQLILQGWEAMMRVCLTAVFSWFHEGRVETLFLVQDGEGEP